MVKFVCAVRDAKSGLFGNPFFEVSHGSAIRSFEHQVNHNDENNLLNTHPVDFTLYALGKFDDNTGMFETATPFILVQALEVSKEHALKKLKVEERKVSKV